MALFPVGKRSLWAPCHSNLWTQWIPQTAGRETESVRPEAWGPVTTAQEGLHSLSTATEGLESAGWLARVGWAHGQEDTPEYCQQAPIKGKEGDRQVGELG